MAIFKNRIEIYNPGRFPDHYSPSDFIKGKQRSILRNPLIANAFYLTSDIERWGSGLSRIYEACKKANVKVEFENLKNGFLVTFYKPSGLLKGAEKGAEKLSINEKVIYRLVKENPYLSKQAMMEKGKMTKKTVEYNIAKLKSRGFLKRVGPDKGGHWKVLKQQEGE